MPITKLNEQQAEESINTKGINHIWVESKTTGEVLGIVCYEVAKDTRQQLGTMLFEYFGENSEICGAVSPPDREENTDIMYMATLD